MTRNILFAFAFSFVVVCQAAMAADPILTLPQKDDTIRLIVTGDAGATHSRLREGILAVQKAKGLDGIILTGDNFYPCGISAVDDPQWTKITEHFGPAGVPVYAVFGNHDYGDAPHDQVVPPLCGKFPTNPLAEIAAHGKVAHWMFPAEQYLVRNALADFVMIDTQPVAMDWSRPYLGSSTSAQVTKFLKESLAATSTTSSAASSPAASTTSNDGSSTTSTAASSTTSNDASRPPWRIVVGHHTLYSSGVHGRTNGFDQQHMRALLPILKSQKVDLYICGHDHDMELLGDLKRRGGPLFLVSGAGSGLDEMRARKPKALAAEPPTIWPSPIAPMYGFALLEISRNELAITFYDQAGVARSGRFVVTKPLSSRQ